MRTVALLAAVESSQEDEAKVDIIRHTLDSWYKLWVWVCVCAFGEYVVRLERGQEARRF